MVGGAPVTQEYADSVGADGFAPDASSAVRLAKKLMVEMGYDVSMGGDDSEGASALATAVQAVEELMVKGHEDE
jgi:hypothetical protein